MAKKYGSSHKSGGGKNLTSTERKFAKASQRKAAANQKSGGGKNLTKTEKKLFQKLG